jgi:hypothetical protein
MKLGMKRIEGKKKFLKTKYYIFFIVLLANFGISAAEVSSWECSKFESSRIIGDDGTYLGKLGPSWLSDSIFNSSSSYGNSWSQNSIFNSSSMFGSSFSSYSAFNEDAYNPPKIVTDEGEFIGFLSIGSGWRNDYFNPLDIKYTCDWD